MTNPITHCRVCATHWTDCDILAEATCATCLARQVERLREYKDDVENAVTHALDERHDDNTRHCTCVPVLREEVKRLRQQLAAADESARLQASTSDERLADCRRLLREACDCMEDPTYNVGISVWWRTWQAAARKAAGDGDEPRPDLDMFRRSEADFAAGRARPIEGVIEEMNSREAAGGGDE